MRKAVGRHGPRVWVGFKAPAGESRKVAHCRGLNLIFQNFTPEVVYRMMFTAITEAVERGDPTLPPVTNDRVWIQIRYFDVQAHKVKHAAGLDIKVQGIPPADVRRIIVAAAERDGLLRLQPQARGGRTGATS